MRLLIVGGAGYVGKVIRPAMEAEFECTHFDLRPVEGAEDRTIVADVGNDDSVRQAVVGMDAVLYLAMGMGKHIGGCNEMGAAFDVNVRGLYRFLHHSLAGGINRFIYASTLSVYKHLGHEAKQEDKPDMPTQEDKPADAWAPYGMSKRVGEFICQAAAQEYTSVTIVALRLMLPRNAVDWPPYRYDPQASNHGCALGPQDTGRLFLAAAHLDQPGFHVMQASGDVEDLSYPNTRVREVLGWTPKNE